MPKKKTKKAATKRFRKTPSGKVRHMGAGRRHLLVAKSRKAKRHLRKGSTLTKADEKRIGSLL